MAKRGEILYYPGTRISAKIQRRIDKIYGAEGPLVKSFAGKTGSSHTLYVVTLKQQPGIVKIGRTVKWSTRRVSYANWNLSNGDAIDQERPFVITEEYVDLHRLERDMLADCPFPLRHGNEWFRADFDEMCRYVDRFICASGLSYLE